MAAAANGNAEESKIRGRIPSSRTREGNEEDKNGYLQGG
jgi:hypothetical protein